MLDNLFQFLIPDFWIIGDSLISHVEDRASFRNLKNLGLTNHQVHWIGKSGMHWNQLLSTLQFNMLYNPSPALILIHVGGNDLVNIKQGKLMKTVKNDLKYISSVFPNVSLVWSDILPRKHWRGMPSTPANLVSINEKRKSINRAGRQVVRSLNHGRYIIHEIETETPGLFLRDGTHLTNIGNDIFLITLQEAIRLFISTPTQMYNADQ